MVNNLMAEAEKKKLQQLILLIAKEIARICDKYNIDYYLDGGSMLGAVRHKGFIPWDDDFDIAMKRSDFERFLQVCEKELDKNKYFLQTEWSEKNYCFSFAKVQLIGTHFIEEFSKDADVKHGIFADIFPYDNLPDTSRKQRWVLWKNHLLKNMLWTKCGYGTEEHKGKLSYKVFKILGLPFSIEFMKKKRYALITQNNKKDTKVCFPSDYPRTKIQNNWFTKPVNYVFESEKFKGFEKYDDFLRTRYGDYMKLPDEKDRVVHSNYKIDFGPYGE